ncbi:PTS galactitol transporter subunit IIC [Schleiferilactobacillus perolens]|uniref:Phosphotransferase system sugar-specific EII component n=1 Tax=Schleiferilactobacillus perolens DSM 12744 TaxID=1423792 RepID=A0A0R1N0D5_9LACO|nr:PTS transporter subunit IIC [Schleiferilactobacillus perolens]KRL13744.1 phosphotransferase system sugar-specific EII component [Schleiferilactobacillus perolens DSM 12744]
MSTIIDFANMIFKPIIKLGAAPIMLIVLTLIAWAIGVKFFKALEGGIKLAIALTGISSVIGLLTNAYQPAIAAFVKSTGIKLSITDLGWAPLATITWGSPYTLFFLAIMIIVNLIMLFWKKTDTLDVDIFDIWHLSFTGLLAIFMGANLLTATLLVIFIGVLKIINSDVMKPTFNDLLDDWENPMTTTHLNYMMNPIIMVFDKIFDKIFPWLDKYDFDAAELNEKIGFWGSRFAIGVYLGIFIGLIAKQNLITICTLSFTAATCLELFSIIGSWFIAAVEPLSQGVSDLANKHLGGRKLNIGLDWPFIAGRAEVWAAANVLAPIMLLEALVLPHNGILPLGGIIGMGVTPALLVVTRGKIIRMIVIGAIELPLFLYAGTASAPFITSVARKLKTPGIPRTGLISSSTKEGPIEQFIAILLGKASHGDVMMMLYFALAIAAYLAIFLWYRHEMKKRNQAYFKDGKDVGPELRLPKLDNAAKA